MVEAMNCSSFEVTGVGIPGGILGFGQPYVPTYEGSGIRPHVQEPHGEYTSAGPSPFTCEHNESRAAARAADPAFGCCGA